MFEDHKDRKKFTEKIATKIVKDNKANGISLDKDRVKGELESVLNIRELFVHLSSRDLSVQQSSQGNSVKTTTPVMDDAIKAANTFFDQEINPQFKPEFKDGVLDPSLCPEGEIVVYGFGPANMGHNVHEFYDDTEVSSMSIGGEDDDGGLEIDLEGDLESCTAEDIVMDMLGKTDSHNHENEHRNMMIEPSESDINIDWENGGPGSSPI